ncbi:MAG TPA: hypothetical protein VF395_19550 [Polyangiaceae bacterium]
MKTRFLALGLAVLSATAVASCGGSRSSAGDAAAVDRGRAADRLRGRWLFVDYRPEQPLEPVLGTLLGAQLGRLVVTFDGRMLTAEGTGFRTQRSYEVTEAAGDAAHLVLQDETGVRYDVQATFVGADLKFHAQTSPWQGTGTLRRTE